MNNLVEEFIKLCSIPSPSGNEDEIKKYLVNRLQGLVDELYVDKVGNIYCRKKGHGDPILYCAHMDTVEPAGKQEPIITNGIITSNGKYVLGADDKAAIAAIIDMLVTLKEHNLTHVSIEILITVREETNAGIRDFPTDKILAKTALLADISRPIGTIITAAPYVSGYSVEVEAPGCHVALISKETVHPLNFLHEFRKIMPFCRVSENTIINIAKVKMGESYNSVPQTLYFTGEIRTFETKYYTDFIETLKKTVTLLDTNLGTKSILTIYPYCSGYMLGEQNIKRIKDSMLELDISPKPIKAFSVGDFNILHEWGIDPINIGTDALEVHTTRERISIESLMQLSNIFVRYSLNSASS